MKIRRKYPRNEMRHLVNGNATRHKRLTQNWTTATMTGTCSRGDGGVITAPQQPKNTLSPPQTRSSLVKHPLQNTENDCQMQWLSDQLGSALNSSLAGPLPGPCWGSSSGPLASLRGQGGPTFKERGREREERKGGA